MKTSPKKGFTLIEVLVVVAIIALLVAILLPALSRVREQTKRTVCAANFKNVGYAYFMYANDHKDVLPPSWSGGFFNAVFDFSKRYWDRRKLGGEVFMCPTFDPLPCPTGDGEGGWDCLRPRTDGLASSRVPGASWVTTGYSFWTHFVKDPHLKDVQLGWTPIREHTIQFDTNPSTVEDLVDTGLVPPWMDKITDTSARIRDRSKYESGWQFVIRRFGPSDVRLAFDQIAYNEIAYGGFHPEIVRHFRDGPTGANILYGDGHIKWKSFKTMECKDQGSGHKQCF